MIVNLIKYLPVLIILIKGNGAFNDIAIFDDEDIYNQAVPQEPQTHGLTVPGTLWCGPGYTANNYNELGRYKDTDKCCRDHDHCPEIIPSKSSLHSLNNNDWFPIMSCDCEQKFINCLQSVNSRVANTMGSIYFGARSKCFAKGHPIQACSRYQSTTFSRRCIQYSVDESKAKVWQFYDVPLYTLGSK